MIHVYAYFLLAWCQMPQFLNERKIMELLKIVNYFRNRPKLTHAKVTKIPENHKFLIQINIIHMC